MPEKKEYLYKRRGRLREIRYTKGKIAEGKTAYDRVYAQHSAKTKPKLFLSRTPLQRTSPQITLFSSAAAEWYEGIKPQIKESTASKYQNLLNAYILPGYGRQPLDRITCEFIEKQCSDLLHFGGKQGTGLSSKTVTDVLSVVRSILKHAIKRGFCVPCDGSGIRIKRSSKPMRILSKAEQNRLCGYLLAQHDPCSLGILICLFTGLRIGEVCALQWEDISFLDQKMHIHSTLQRIQKQSDSGSKTKVIVSTPKSACSVRLIPIPDPLLQILSAYKTAASGYVLTNSTQEYIEPRRLQNGFKKALKQSNIEPANFHALRHTFATRCVELGFDVKSLSEILGHAAVNITMNRYVHPTFESKQENMKKLSTLLNYK